MRILGFKHEPSVRAFHEKFYELLSRILLVSSFPLFQKFSNFDIYYIYSWTLFWKKISKYY